MIDDVSIPVGYLGSALIEKESRGSASLNEQESRRENCGACIALDTQCLLCQFKEQSNNKMRFRDQVLPPIKPRAKDLSNNPILPKSVSEEPFNLKKCRTYLTEKEIDMCDIQPIDETERNDILLKKISSSIQKNIENMFKARTQHQNNGPALRRTKNI